MTEVLNPEAIESIIDQRFMRARESLDADYIGFMERVADIVRTQAIELERSLAVQPTRETLMDVNAEQARIITDLTNEVGRLRR